MALQNPNYLTVAEVAALLRLSKMTVYRMIQDDELLAIEIGRRNYRIPEDAVRRFLPPA